MIERRPADDELEAWLHASAAEFRRPPDALSAAVRAPEQRGRQLPGWVVAVLPGTGLAPSSRLLGIPAGRVVAVVLVVGLVAGAGLGAAFFGGASTDPAPAFRAATVLYPTRSTEEGDDGGDVVIREVALGSALDRLPAPGGVLRRIADPLTCPSIAPDGSRLAWVRAGQPNGGEVVVGAVDGDAGPDEVLANLHGTMLTEPRWSPDGTRLLLVVASNDGVSPERRWHRSDPTGQLSVIEVSSGHVSVLADHAAAPAWSPDGTLVAYLVRPGGVEGASFELRVVDLMGRSGVPGRDDGLLFPGLAGATTPAWSPDASRIAYVDRDSGLEERPMLVVARLADRSRLTLAMGTDHEYGAPSWSPDGSLVAVAKVGPTTDPDDGSSVGGFAIFDADGGEVARPGSLGGDSVPNALLAPAWSPDGRWLVGAIGPDMIWHDRSTGRSMSIFDAVSPAPGCGPAFRPLR